MYTPTMWDWSTYLGTIGLFLSLMFLFVRFVPMIPVFEVQLLLPKKEAKESK
jgi:molybdopterin-containing oxidoreductase family membrane subunit